MSELRQGRLRQGWGYLDNQNLETIEHFLASDEPLTDDQYRCWRGNRRLLHSQEDGVALGDIVFLPNLPEDGQWLVAEVVGTYAYSIDPTVQDLGHILPVKLLNQDAPINPLSKHVCANLRRSFTCRSRFWSLELYREDVSRLLDALQRDEDLTNATEAVQHLRDLQEANRKRIECALRQHFGAAEFEKPVKMLLKSIYGKDAVQHTGGSTEKGADFKCVYVDPLGLEHVIVIQVKMWEGIAADGWPLQQIKQRVKHEENVAAGIVMAMAEEMSDSFRDQLRDLQRDSDLQHVNIDVMLRDSICDLFERYLPDIVLAGE